MLSLVHMMEQSVEWKGEHFWSLVGKLAVTLGMPLAVPIVITIFWLGQLSTRVDNEERQTTHLIEVISGLVTYSSQETERSSTNTEEIRRLRDKVDGLLQIKH